MADVNDTHGIKRRLKRRRCDVRASYRDGRITKGERDAILAFARYRLNDQSRNTVINDLSTLRCAAERSEIPLLEMTAGAKDSFFARLAGDEDAERFGPDGNKSGFGLDRDGSGYYNYERAFKVFFKVLDNREKYPSYPWWQELDPSSSDDSVDRDRLEHDDIAALKDATGSGENPKRDRALISFMSECPRVTAVGQLLVGGMHPFGPDPYWELNVDVPDGYKSMDDDKRTLLWSVADMRAYLRDAHPAPENDKAPLWVADWDPSNPQKCALSNDGIRSMLNRTASRAGVDTDKVCPHNFRHYAITRMVRDDDIPTDVIKHLAGWTDLRPLERYDDSTDDERNNVAREAIGMNTTDTVSEPPEMTECWNCREQLAGDEDFCPKCGEIQSNAARMLRNNAQDAVKDGLREDSNGERAATRAEILDALDDPEIIGKIVEQL